MATYNGGRYLDEQIKSIFDQTETNWRLIIRDDCSNDNTKFIIRNYAERYPEKIFVLENNGEKLGACQNFARLLEHSSANYIMFCDQDDIWLPNKIAVTLEKMSEMEEALGEKTPLMVHTDMKVVDENLDPIAESFWQLLRLKPANGNKLNRLVLQNVPSGCAMMINKSLRDTAAPIPREAVMHDWWLCLVAAAFGKTGYLQIPTVLYRQHGMNVCGAGNRFSIQMMRKILTSKSRQKLNINRNETIEKSQKQAAAFLVRYDSALPDNIKIILRTFLVIKQKGFFVRRYYILRYGYFYGSIIDNMGMLLFR
jgi:glycosyltransferase involved in cell wall biosynthesis